MDLEPDLKEDWKVTTKGKRVWEGNTGVYSVGWEREVLDL
jgi:hypothetical protein